MYKGASTWGLVAATLMLVAVVRVSPAAAQLPTYGVGRPPSPEEVATRDQTIPADGEGLPPGSGTAVLGKPIYVDRCGSCHGEKGEDPKYSLLVGGRGTLTTAKPVLTVGSFWPHAPTLWSYIRRSQPIDQPGSLTPDEAYAVTAYLLYLNGIIGEHDVMDAHTLPRVQMPNRDGFVSDSRPDVGPQRKSSTPRFPFAQSGRSIGVPRAAPTPTRPRSTSGGSSLLAAV